MDKRAGLLSRCGCGQQVRLLSQQTRLQQAGPQRERERESEMVGPGALDCNGGQARIHIECVCALQNANHIFPEEETGNAEQNGTHVVLGIWVVFKLYLGSILA